MLMKDLRPKNMIELLITDEVDTGLEKLFFEKIAETVLEKAGVKRAHIQLSLLITGDEQIKELNKLYRNIDSATDVLSFPQFEMIEEITEDSILGDIVISFETAQNQADEAGIAVEREMAFLFIHGLLHLLGYDHEVSEDEEIVMFDLQESILLGLVEEKFII